MPGVTCTHLFGKVGCDDESIILKNSLTRTFFLINYIKILFSQFIIKWIYFIWGVWYSIHARPWP